MSLVKQKDCFIHVPIYYMEKTVKGFTKTVIIKEEKAKKMMEDESTKSSIKVNNFYFSLYTWNMQKHVQKNCYYLNVETGIQDFDWVRARDMKLVQCLKKWDLLDENGRDLPVTQENIDSLQPEVVTYLLDELEEISSVSYDDSKN